MVDTHHFEESIAAALNISQREIGHLVTLNQLRRAIEEALGQGGKNTSEGASLVPADLPLA